MYNLYFQFHSNTKAADYTTVGVGAPSSVKAPDNTVIG